MIVSPRKALVSPVLSSYDFEWATEDDSTYRITLGGAYDERGYRSYPSVRRFLRGELIPSNSGRRYYAHFGGASDMVFLLTELIRDDRYQVKGVFSSSSAIVVVVTRGLHHWMFIDSFWLMRTKLANIGAWMGFPKLEVDFNKVTPAELRTYNERDCEILYRALLQFREVIESCGGELGVTAASTAMKTFLRKYLKRPIKNGAMHDAYARPAYTASRVEVIRRDCQKANVYDINSSFPYSMTFPCPGSSTGSNKKAIGSNKLWIAQCDVVTTDNYLPTLPYRDDEGKLYFPSGQFRTTITSEDYAAGGFDIKKVYSCRSYEDRDDLRAFAEDFYRMRKASGGFEGECFKIVLNALYGKFAEREEKQALYVRPSKVNPEWEAIAPHIYLETEIVSVPHSHVPISCLITARSRRFLLEQLRCASTQGRVYYCDTDSVTCDATLETSAELGGLKLEKQIVRGRFEGAKLYATETEDGRQQVKAKGFSRVVSDAGEREPLTYEDFVELTEGKAVHVERMLRIRELIRRDGLNYTPRQERQEKRLGKKSGQVRVMPRQKRCHLANGDSRPWSVDEIDQGM